MISTKLICAFCTGIRRVNVTLSSSIYLTYFFCISFFIVMFCILDRNREVLLQTVGLWSVPTGDKNCNAEKGTLYFDAFVSLLLHT